MSEKYLSPVQQRLDEPEQQISLSELAKRWFMQQVEVIIPFYGFLLENEETLSFIRRAWGSELMKGASQNALEEKACSWSPPCALNIFFWEQLRFGKHGLPKPYIFSSDKRGQDLIIKLGIFGFACEWLMPARESLVKALRFGVDWKKLAAGSFLPKIEIATVRVATIKGIKPIKAPNSVELNFITPLDTTGRNNILDEPYSLVGRLARRIDGLARWQDVELNVNWQELSEYWKGLDYWTGELFPSVSTRWSNRQRSKLVNRAVVGQISISGEIEPIWELLQIGQFCHVGRGAVIGQGRYEMRIL